MREEGWYFVKPFQRDFDWEHAYWTAFPPCWSCVGTTRLFKDIDFVEIDERRIVRIENKESILKEIPILMQPNDTRVMVNGAPLPVAFRIISEDNYQKLIS